MLDIPVYKPSSAPEKKNTSREILSMSEGMKEKNDRENMNILVTRISTTLGGKFEEKNIPFDIRGFKAILTKAVEGVFLNNKIPTEVKEKFKQDMLKKVDLLAKVDISDIELLQKRRTVNSIGTEWYELRDKTNEEKQAFFLNKILEETIEKNIESTAYSLEKAFCAQQMQHPAMKGVAYNQENYLKFTAAMQDMDSKLGLRVYDRAIIPLTNSTDLSKMNFRHNIGTVLIQELASKGYKVKDSAYFQNLVGNTSALSSGVRKSDRREGETTIVDKQGNPVMVEGKKIDGVDLLLGYFDGVDHFQGVEREISGTKEAALNQGISSKAKEMIGAQQLKSEFDYLNLDNMEAKMKNKSLADFVIIATQLAQLAPVVDDIGGGLDDIVSAYSGMNIEGAKIDALDRSLNAIFGILGISVVGGFAVRAYKAGKIEKLLKSFQVIRKYLPEKMADYTKNGGILPESTKHLLEKIFPALEPAYLMPKSSTGKGIATVPKSHSNTVGSIDKADNVGKSIIRFKAEGKSILIQDLKSTSEMEIRQELSRILEKSDVQTIQFSPQLDTTKKRILANILAKNHPLIEVLRLIPGNNVVNVSFSGIKKLNDKYGQAFVDELLAVSKAKIMGGVESYTKAKGGQADNIRLVRDNYKNITFSVPKDGDIQAILFSQISSKSEFINSIINSPQFEAILKEKAKDGGKSIAHIKKDILENWNFGVGKSQVGVGMTDEQKLHTFAKAELVSRDGVSEEKIVIRAFDDSKEGSRTLQFARKSVEQENRILEKYRKGDMFTLGGVKYPIILDIDGKKYINPDLLRQVRKDGNKAGIEPNALCSEIKEYIDTLNAGFDFITPAHSLDDIEKDLAEARKISDNFGKGIIEKKTLLNNFKGVMTKEHFMQTMSNKQGLRMFIDIKDMGVLNLQSFQRLSRKVAARGVEDKDILSAGVEVTESFKRLKKEIQKHPDVQITLGGDEVYLFFPGATEKQTNNLLQSIHQALKESHLEGRVSHSLEVGKSEDVFKKLDESTKFHKMLEKMLHESKRPQVQHETISLDIGGGRTEEELATVLTNPKTKEILKKITQKIATNPQGFSEGVKIPTDVGNLSCTYEKGIFHFIFV